MFILIDTQDLARIDLAEAIEDHSATQVVDLRAMVQNRDTDYPHGLFQALTEQSGSLYHYWGDRWEEVEGGRLDEETLAAQLLRESLLGISFVLLPGIVFQDEKVDRLARHLCYAVPAVRVLTDQGLQTWEEAEKEKTGGQMTLFDELAPPENPFSRQ